MGFVLDAIVVKNMVGSRDLDGTNFETINVSGVSDSVDTSGTEQGFLVLISYANGVGNNVVFRVEGSSDNTNFGAIENAEQTVTDSDGSVTFDLININANYIRISWEVSAGSVDIFGHLSGKRRH